MHQVTVHRHRKWLSVLAVPAAGLLAATSAAWACTGTQNIATKIVVPISKSGGPGTLIKAKSAESPLMPVGWKFDLIFADSAHLNLDPECHHAQVPRIGGPTISVAGVAPNTGRIPKTIGTVPALTPTGQAAVCFAKTKNYGTLNTLPDFFTVL